MKRILITGANSYVGTSVQKWLEKEPNKYEVQVLEMKDPKWIIFDFSKFDVVLHVAGIVHIKETKKNTLLYYQINRDLAIEVAKKSKLEGVKQFVYLSSMSVYNPKATRINLTTVPNPITHYGKSKLEAEIQIQKMNDQNFIVSIIRPPMIYGEKAKGNFPKLVSLANSIILFPKLTNTRSMLYIGNFCSFVQYLIDKSKEGLFFPQNSDYVSTYEVVKKIASIKKRRIWFTKIFNPLIALFRRRITVLGKLFGDLYYDKEMSIDSISTNVYSFDESLDYLKNE